MKCPVCDHDWEVKCPKCKENPFRVTGKRGGDKKVLTRRQALRLVRIRKAKRDAREAGSKE